MIWLYRLIFWPLFLLMLPRYMWRLWRRGGQWRVAERFGGIQPPAKDSRKRVWVHAVSVGELNAIRPLLESLKQNTGLEVVLSTTTTTGYKLAKDKLQNLVSYIFTFPIDGFSSVTFNKLNPDLVILMEGELWPECLHQANKRKIPVYLINARLSDRSFKRLSAMRGVASWVVRKVARILSATKQDAERFVALGANPELVTVTGNLKFDATSSNPITEEKKAALLKSLGWTEKDVIILGSSTWAGEEAALVNAYGELKQSYPQLKLLITPRHAERGAEIEPLLKTFFYHRRSRGEVQGAPEIVLADTTGELSSLVYLATIVYVGKSMLPHTEGQSPIEPAAAGKAVVMGYGMSNFRQIAQNMILNKAGIFLAGPVELKETLKYLLENPTEREALAQRAATWYLENRGATERTLEWLELSTNNNYASPSL